MVLCMEQETVENIALQFNKIRGTNLSRHLSQDETFNYDFDNGHVCNQIINGRNIPIYINLKKDRNTSTYIEFSNKTIKVLVDNNRILSFSFTNFDLLKRFINSYNLRDRNSNLGTKFGLLKSYLEENNLTSYVDFYERTRITPEILTFYLLFDIQLLTEYDNFNNIINIYKSVFSEIIITNNLRFVYETITAFLHSTKLLIFNHDRLAFSDSITSIPTYYKSTTINDSTQILTINLRKVNNECFITFKNYSSRLFSFTPHIKIEDRFVINRQNYFNYTTSTRITFGEYQGIRNDNFSSFLITNENNVENNDLELQSVVNKTKILSKSKDKNVDFITGEKINDSDTILTRYGYTNKNHPFIKEDFLIKGQYLFSEKLIDKNSKFYSLVSDLSKNNYQIFDGLDENNFLTNKNYNLTIISPSGNGPLIDSNLDKYGVFYCKKEKISSFVTPEVVNNKSFQINYFECITDGVFYLKEDNPSLYKNNVVKPKIYGIKKNRSLSFKEIIGNVPMTYIGTYGKKYTFGLEIETISGFLPRRFNDKISFTAVHDGSLRQEDGNTYGLEYVTGVYEGDKGLLMTKKLSNELSKRCLINKQCSIHSHLGNVNFNKENIVLMYYIFFTIQDELFQIMPPSRRNNEYCRALPDMKINIEALKSTHRDYLIDKWYNDIVKFLSAKDYSGKYINKKKQHPKGAKCSYDHSTARYCWVNMVPSLFNTRENGIYTIEFRLMSATTNYKKIKAWLLICFALVDIVENHKNLIYDDEFLSSGKSWNLDKLITSVYPQEKAQKEIFEFINSRRVKFSGKYTDPHIEEQNEMLDNPIDENFKIINL